MSHSQSTQGRRVAMNNHLWTALRPYLDQLPTGLAGIMHPARKSIAYQLIFRLFERDKQRASLRGLKGQIEGSKTVRHRDFPKTHFRLEPQTLEDLRHLCAEPPPRVPMVRFCTLAWIVDDPDRSFVLPPDIDPAAVETIGAAALARLEPDPMDSPHRPPHRVLGGDIRVLRDPCGVRICLSGAEEMAGLPGECRPDDPAFALVARWAGINVQRALDTGTPSPLLEALERDPAARIVRDLPLPRPPPFYLVLNAALWAACQSALGWDGVMAMLESHTDAQEWLRAQYGPRSGQSLTPGPIPVTG